MVIFFFLEFINQLGNCFLHAHIDMIFASECFRHFFFFLVWLFGSSVG